MARFSYSEIASLLEYDESKLKDLIRKTAREETCREEAICTMFQKGFTVRQIAQALECSELLVDSIIRDHENSVG